ncbi:MAG: radical SAM protein [Bdellovibrionota bacterium]
MDNFFNLTLPELENILATEEVPKVHARNIFASVYRDDQKKTSLLPQKIKKLLPTISESVELKIKSINISNYDQSIKFVLQTKENLLFETVLMPEKGRLTICLSSQIGCAQGCIFCYTGKMGLIRNLTVNEIIEQIVIAQQWIRNTPSWSQQVEKTMLTPFKSSVTNVVFMGMGEPLDNANNVIKAVHIMTDTHGLGIAPRKVTISTAGHIPELNMLKQANLKTGLAISLHAHNDSSRNKIMPINKKWNLKILIGLA